MLGQWLVSGHIYNHKFVGMNELILACFTQLVFGVHYERKIDQRHADMLKICAEVITAFSWDISQRPWRQCAVFGY